MDLPLLENSLRFTVTYFPSQPYSTIKYYVDDVRAIGPNLRQQVKPIQRLAVESNIHLHASKANVVLV